MIALGVDSGSLSTGYGVVERRGSSYRSLDYGAIRNTSKTPHSERLLVIYEHLIEVIERFQPSILSLEGVFMSKNAQSALKLGQVRGAVMVTAASRGVKIREFSPAEVKSAVTGYGRAEKEQVQKMVKSMLGLPSIPRPHDAADALALALCALASSTWEEKVTSR